MLFVLFFRGVNILRLNPYHRKVSALILQDPKFSFPGTIYSTSCTHITKKTHKNIHFCFNRVHLCEDNFYITLLAKTYIVLTE